MTTSAEVSPPTGPNQQDAPAPRAVIVANPKESGGADRRTESIAALLDHLGYDTQVIQPRIAPHLPHPRDLLDLARGRTVPESLVWNVQEVIDEVIGIDPTVVVLQTGRVVNRGLLSNDWVTIVDLVDSLSASYRQRSAQTGRLAGAGLRLLGWTHQRFEQRVQTSGVPLVSAGHRESSALGAEWIPNVVALPESTSNPTVPWAERPYDTVFFGTLSYQPNVEALELFAHWAESTGFRPSMLVAGRRPTAEVERLCHRMGWALTPDFPSIGWLADQARVAIAPLRSTAGIQNKVLEAGAIGLAQVVTSAAIAGLDPHTPLVGDDTADAFTGRLRRLLADPEEAALQVDDMQGYLNENLSVAAVAPRLGAVIDSVGGDRGRPVMVEGR